MKEKYGIKLADFIREMINTIILKKPVKSRVEFLSRSRVV